MRASLLTSQAVADIAKTVTEQNVLKLIGEQREHNREDDASLASQKAVASISQQLPSLIGEGFDSQSSQLTARVLETLLSQIEQQPDLLLSPASKQKLQEELHSHLHASIKAEVSAEASSKSLSDSEIQNLVSQVFGALNKAHPLSSSSSSSPPSGQKLALLTELEAKLTGVVGSLDTLSGNYDQQKKSSSALSASLADISEASAAHNAKIGALVGVMHVCALGYAYSCVTCVSATCVYVCKCVCLLSLWVFSSI